jgi:N-acetylglucosamine-6-phosphate deacetylase
MIDAGELLLCGGRALVGDEWREPCDVRVADGRIAALGADLPTDGASVIDAAGLEVVPGLVDLHVHGAGGAMFEDGRTDAVHHIRAALAANGTTAILATLAALAPADLERAVAAIATGGDGGGARVLGIHLEGPFLNPRRAGAQRSAWMRAPDIDEVDRLQACCGGLIRHVTVAPELPGALPFIAALRQRSITASLGHSEASAEVVEAAIEAGATHVTHLFNAMAPLHHRAVGLAGVALSDDRLAVELIADGVHVDRRALALAVRAKPPAGWLLVSDGVAAVGCPPGPIRLFGADCVIDDAVRLAGDGRLAGSCLTLAAAVRNLRAWLPALPPAAVFDAASRHPAASIGRGAECGALAVGRAADLVVLGPIGEVRAVVLAGQLIADAGARPAPSATGPHTS